MGALLIVGLFLFLRSKSPEIHSAEMKPSRLNFAQSNQFPQVIPKQELPTENTQKTEPSHFENFSIEDKEKWTVFENILKTKNDNDPRLDQNLKILNPTLRQALYERYAWLPPEDHSGRGLIVFLIAREITSLQDVEFLKKVYEEPPCLSLVDCGTLPPNDPHHSSTDQTTLVYQQLSGLYLIEKQLSENPKLLNDAAFRSEVTEVLITAESFPVPAIHEKAQSIRTKYGL